MAIKGRSEETQRTQNYCSTEQKQLCVTLLLSIKKWRKILQIFNMIFLFELQAGKQIKFSKTTLCHCKSVMIRQISQNNIFFLPSHGRPICYIILKCTERLDEFCGSTRLHESHFQKQLSTMKFLSLKSNSTLICPVVKCIPASVQECNNTVMLKAKRTSHIILKHSRVSH
jgi:hypothetical protein